MVICFRMESPKTRRNMTVRDKLRIIDEYKAKGLSYRKFAATKGIHESMVRKWVKSEEDYRRVSTTQVKKIRKIPRKKIGMWPEIDTSLLKWVTDRNKKGLRVKDKFIQMTARNIRDKILATVDDGDYKSRLMEFKASKIFVHRFKQRWNLRSRRHTTTHTLPERFREQAVEFIDLVHRKISEFDIPRERIINLDQVRKLFWCFLIQFNDFFIRFPATTKTICRRQLQRREERRFRYAKVQLLTRNLLSLRSSRRRESSW